MTRLRAYLRHARLCRVERRRQRDLRAAAAAAVRDALADADALSESRLDEIARAKDVS